MTFTATTTVPFPHLERAMAGLRGALRQNMLAAGVVAAPGWSALAVTGPQEFADERGQVCFGDSATLGRAGHAGEGMEGERTRWG